MTYTAEELSMMEPLPFGNQERFSVLDSSPLSNEELLTLSANTSLNESLCIGKQEFIEPCVEFKMHGEEILKITQNGQIFWTKNGERKEVEDAKELGIALRYWLTLNINQLITTEGILDISTNTLAGKNIGELIKTMDGKNIRLYVESINKVEALESLPFKETCTDCGTCDCKKT